MSQRGEYMLEDMVNPVKGLKQEIETIWGRL